jgi:hypothetical protein
MPDLYHKSPEGARREQEREKQRQREQKRIRMKYRKGLRLDKDLIPGEAKHLEDMCVVMKLAGYSKTQIVGITGLSLPQVNDVFALPGVAERLVYLRANLTQAALDLLQGYQVEAIQTIVDIMRTGIDDKIVLQAAGEILDRSGLVKASRQERLQVNEQRTVFTDDGIIEKLREASPEVQERAATMIEDLEQLLEKNMAPTRTENGKPVKKKR